MLWPSQLILWSSFFYQCHQESRVLSTFDLHTLTIPWAVDGSIDTLANLQSCLRSRSYEQLWAVIDDDWWWSGGTPAPGSSPVPGMPVKVMIGDCDGGWWERLVFDDWRDAGGWWWITNRSWLRLSCCCWLFDGLFLLVVGERAKNECQKLEVNRKWTATEPQLNRTFGEIKNYVLRKTLIIRISRFLLKRFLIMVAQHTVCSQ